MEVPNPKTVGVNESQLAALQASRDQPIPSAKVAVIGGGLAGLCAVIEAQKKGANVFLFEKQARIGGNSAKATSGINGLNTFATELSGFKDSFNKFKADTLRSGGGLSDQSLVDTLVSNSTDTVNWLHEIFSLDLTDLTQLGGHSAPRTHRLPPKDGRPVPVGYSTISSLRKHIDNLENVTIVTDATLTQIMTEKEENDTFVTGIKYSKNDEIQSFMCDAVVLTTGGYAYDRSEGSLLKEFVPTKVHLPTTSGSQADGGAIRIARRDTSAKLVDMEYVQVHPTGLVDPSDPKSSSKMLAPEAMRGCGGVLFNYLGKRFCDELGTRDYVTACIEKFCRKESNGESMKEQSIAYLTMNEESAELFGSAALDFYEKKGMINRCNGLSELSSFIGCDENVLMETLEEVNSAAKGEINDPCGRTVFRAPNFDPNQMYLVALITPCIHYTMGGIAINASAEVLLEPSRSESHGNASHPIVLGLYAAGECTGGVHGANRLAGNSLLECAVFGRIAGSRSADITSSIAPALDPKIYLPLRLRCRRTLSARGHIHEFTFDLPSSKHKLAPFFKPGQYISIRHTHHNAEPLPEPLDRYYSPVSRDGARGEITLLIKAEPERGPVQGHLCSMTPGDSLLLRGPCGGLSFDLFDPKVERVGLICGGSGVSPMVQIIRECLFANVHKSIRLVWGVEYSEDLVYRKIMDEQARKHSATLNLTYVVNKPDFGWVGEIGMIDEDMLRRYMFRPGKGTKIVVCGPWKMCQIMKELLKNMGYTEDMVYSFM